jgi:uncharacterized protein YqgC (DUF456 family)
MNVVWAMLLFAVLVFAWMLNLFGLPGNWINVLAAGLYAYLMSGDERVDVGWPVIIVAFLLACLGELIEFAASAAGVAKTGGTKRGAVLAILGSFAGGVVGAFVGLPIPVIGSILAIVIFASLGAMGGAMLGERWAGRDFDVSVEVGHAAFWGRLLGTVGKIIVGVMIVLIVTAALFVR